MTKQGYQACVIAIEWLLHNRDSIVNGAGAESGGNHRLAIIHSTAVTTNKDDKHISQQTCDTDVDGTCLASTTSSSVDSSDKLYQENILFLLHTVRSQMSIVFGDVGGREQIKECDYECLKALVLVSVVMLLVGYSFIFLVGEFISC